MILKFPKSDPSIGQDELGYASEVAISAWGNPTFEIQAHLGQSKDHFLKISGRLSVVISCSEMSLWCVLTILKRGKWTERWEFFLLRVKNDQIHQKINLGAVLALEAKRRVRAPQKTVTTKLHQKQKFRQSYGKSICLPYQSRLDAQCTELNRIQPQSTERTSLQKIGGNRKNQKIASGGHSDQTFHKKHSRVFVDRTNFDWR